MACLQWAQLDAHVIASDGPISYVSGLLDRPTSCNRAWQNRHKGYRHAGQMIMRKVYVIPVTPLLEYGGILFFMYSCFVITAIFKKSSLCEIVASLEQEVQVVCLLFATLTLFTGKRPKDHG